MQETDTAPHSSGAFKHLLDEFQTLCAARGDDRAVMYFRMAGRALRVTAIGHNLLWRVSGAFRHLQDPTPDLEGPMLTIDVWEPPANAGPLPEFGPSSLRFVIHQERGYTAVLDRDRHHLLVRIERLTNAFLARPLCAVMWPWLRHFELHQLRAAVISRGGRGLLLCGAPGSGLSTLSLMCLEAGFGFLGDGAALLERTQDGFVAHSLYATIALAPEIARTHPQWRDDMLPAYRPRLGHDIDIRARSGNEKSVLMVADARADQTLDTVPIAAIVVTLTDEERTEPAVLLPLLREAALAALVEDRESSATVSRDAMHTEVFALTRLTPCYGLMRRNAAEDPVALLKALADSLRTGAAPIKR